MVSLGSGLDNPIIRLGRPIDSLFLSTPPFPYLIQGTVAGDFEIYLFLIYIFLNSTKCW
jgi:hypothetical protein